MLLHTHMHTNTQVLCGIKMAHNLDTLFNFTNFPMMLNFELRSTSDGILWKYTFEPRRHLNNDTQMMPQLKGEEGWVGQGSFPQEFKGDRLAAAWKH